MGEGDGGYVQDPKSLNGSWENVSTSVEHVEKPFSFNLRTDRIMKGKLKVITE